MTTNPNKPFVGKTEDLKKPYESGRSLRAFLRGALKKKTHIGMKSQVITAYKLVGATMRKQKDGTTKLTGGKKIVVGAKLIWHDAAVIKAKKS